MGELMKCLGPRSPFSDAAREKHRRHAVYVLANYRLQRFPPDAREWLTYWASIPPLNRTIGEPK